jgi:hypothetical protein
MPKPEWNKKTISTYISEEQKKVWEKCAIAECKGLAFFVRDRVESTINNKNFNGKSCLWLEIPKELYDKAQNEFHEGHLNPLENFVQNHIYRIVNEDKNKEFQWQQLANSPDVETLKSKIEELEMKIESLKAENVSLGKHNYLSESSVVLNALKDSKTFLTLEQIATLIDYNPKDDDRTDLSILYQRIEDLMYDVGMIEYKQGKGYKFNPDIEPVEREGTPRPDLTTEEKYEAKK